MKEGVKIKKVYFYNNKKQRLVGILGESNKKNIIIICHGFGGNKNRNYTLYDYFLKNNFSVLIFDFTGNGESEGEFSDGNYTQEIDDLGKAIDFVKNLNYKKIVVMGHSMGGSISILRTAIDSRINFLVSIAGVGYPSKFRDKYINSEDKVKELNWNGYIILKHNEKKLTKEFLEDVEKYNVVNSVKKVKIPLLIIHAEKDESISFKESKAIYENANEPKKMEIIPNADHCFGFKPMNCDNYNIKQDIAKTKEYNMMKEKILEFLRKV